MTAIIEAPAFLSSSACFSAALILLPTPSPEKESLVRFRMPIIIALSSGKDSVFVFHTF